MTLTETYIRTLSQGVDFLGFIREQLTGLTGFVTLVQELIQNAEDAKASTISFDFREEALVVINDSTFSTCGRIEEDACPRLMKDGRLVDCDFHRMRSLASGRKRDEPGTIGTFGIGFLSVYQVCDHPQVLSSGVHWTFFPEEAPEKRIAVSPPHDRPGTTFILPWAKDARSPVRQGLGLGAVTDEDIVQFLHDTLAALPNLLLFLAHLRRIEVRQSRALIATVERRDEGDSIVTIVVHGKPDLVNGRTERWLILSSHFNRPSWPEVESKRRTEVRIALPFEVPKDGLFFAFLPTTMETRLPLHVHADFYTDSSRKGIIKDGHDYRVRWNRLAVAEAADLLARSLLHIRDTLGPKVLTECLRRAYEVEARQNPLLGVFWERISAAGRSFAIAYTSTRSWVQPHVLVLDSLESTHRNLLEKLGLPLVHPEAQPAWNALRALGAAQLTLGHVIEAARALSIAPGTPLSAAPEPLNSQANLETLYGVIDVLLGTERPAQDKLLKQLAVIPIGLSTRGTLERPSDLRRAPQEVQEAFGFITGVQFVHDIGLSCKALAKLIPDFDIHDAVRVLSALTADDFLDAYTAGRWRPEKTYQFFVSNWRALLENPALKASFFDIPMFMSKDTFKPLKELSLPGDFKDPLGLDILVSGDLDESVLGLLRKLGVRELDLPTYVKSYLPKALEGDVETERLRKLVRELAKGIGVLRDHPDALAALRVCPLVECDDGKFRRPGEVYFDGPTLQEILGKGNYRYAVNATGTLPESLIEFYKLLGVTDKPRPHDVLVRVSTLASQKPTQDNVRQMEAVFSYLARSWSDFDEPTRAELQPLRSLAWLPAEGDSERWWKPSELHTKDREHLFRGQARFLGFAKAASGVPREFRSFLGLLIDPSPAQVARYLMVCAANRTAPSPEIYRFLATEADPDEVHRLLADKPCIHVGGGRFVTPDQVFWEAHDFGPYRFQLPNEYRVFSQFFRAVGVKDRPSTEDYVSVLVDISNRFGPGNLPIDQATEAVVHTCFAELQRRLEAGELSETVVAPLGDRKVVPQADMVLYEPRWVLIDDKPTLAAKFGKLLERNLILRDPSTWRILEKIGVRLLSKAVHASPQNHQSSKYDESLTSLIRERRPLFERIVEARRQQGVEGWRKEILDLEVYHAPELEVVYSIPDFRISTPPVAQVAFVDPTANRLYVRDNSGGSAALREMAKEIAAALNPSIDVSDMAPLIREILTLPPVEGHRALDEYGIARLAVFPPRPVEPARAEPLDEAGPSVDGFPVGRVVVREPQDHKEDSPSLPQRKPQPHGTPPCTQLTEPSTQAAKPFPGQPPAAERQPQRNVTESVQHKELVSRVRSRGSAAEAERPTEEEESKRTGKAGVALVMEFERQQGRRPKEMDQYHPGYDIESYGPDGQVERYIEVKSITGPWEGYRVSLTATQFETARKYGDKYFLYVVDNIETPQHARLHIVRDPGRRGNAYAFDEEWANEVVPLADYGVQPWLGEQKAS